MKDRISQGSFSGAVVRHVPTIASVLLLASAALAQTPVPGSSKCSKQDCTIANGTDGERSQDATVVTAKASLPEHSVSSEAVANAVVVVPRKVQKHGPPDSNRETYYKNKLEFSAELGCLPANIPFVFNFAIGDPNKIDDPLRYVLVPIVVSLRWQPDNVAGPFLLRGNWDLSVSAAITPIVKGPETHYLAYVMGVRRNFVHRNWRTAPFLEGRVGLGHEDATQPKGEPYGQGQDFAFTFLLGAGFRYNLSPHTAFWVGSSYMHISNLYLSEPRYSNYGINVLGPMIGLDYRLGHQRVVE